MKNVLGVEKSRLGCLFAVVLVALSGCITPPSVPPAGQLLAPTPIMGNTGEYMCPFTTDGVMAEWTNKAIAAKMGAAIGRTAGAYAGQKACEQIPFVGGIIGAKVGDMAGRAIAIQAIGGMAYIKDTSDLSFNTIEDLAIYIYVKHSTHEHYADALSATQEIYPDLKTKYIAALMSAPRDYNPSPAVSDSPAAATASSEGGNTVPMAQNAGSDNATTKQ